MSDFSPVYGQNPTTGAQEPLQTDGANKLRVAVATVGAGTSIAINDNTTPSRHWTIDATGAGSFNITELAGVAVGLANPFIFQDQLRAYAINAQMFSSTTGLQTSAGAVQTALSVFNPAASGKTLAILSIHVATAAGAQHHINSVTVDPALANAATPTNNRFGGAASVANATFLNAAVANSGTVVATTGTGGNTVTEAMQNGTVYVVPSGNGIVVFVTTSTNAWQVTAQWIEF